jgi:hypothetical protein
MSEQIRVYLEGVTKRTEIQQARQGLAVLPIANRSAANTD